MSRILITGKTGQVGYELERSLQGLGEIIAVDRSQMDLADLDQVRDVIRRVKPTLIVNPAAYTAVDKAESEPELALRINGEAPGVMAEEAKKLGAAMIHYSTDYVFDGSKDGAYVETDPTCPVNVYGSSKLAGEQAIQAAGIPHLILRTSWVYSTHGKNFLLTMRRLAQEREELGIVSDQYGAPTWSRTIADTTAHIVAQSLAAADQRTWWDERSGLYHLTAQGKTSWFGFTEAIMAHPSVVKKPKLKPILAQDYPVPAKRPSNSVLSSQRLIDTFCNLPQWQTALKLCQE
ncbi:dTDP-4-dehydrorhamnose reductase [Janthinobacterium lividum]|uniref:dTDP-4-dehydrorhamnose reductase n=1 Tax=unclassified Janthinobacterium TaxID=2610881 RepID=UPI0008848425|nr:MULTISPECIES: dTDP-4-dehydrorhamnose reductase [unclassified Janthinobacterium]PHV21356.1 dTDP-4-dehydrorhamnose reductase [Janthinobacterium sp. BJB446]SDH12366.1 dTDP-4-dehydrorhamnose reductase [Janthinobacterium sp. YR213]